MKTKHISRSSVPSAAVPVPVPVRTATIAGNGRAPLRWARARARARWAFVLSTCALVASALCGGVAAAQRATVRLETDRRLLAPGDAIEIKVTVVIEGATAFANYQAPPMPGFRRAGRTMRSQRMHVDQFSMRVERTDVYTYTATASETGVLTIGPASVTVGGRNFRSNTVAVTVRPPRDRSSAAGSRDSAPGSGGLPDPGGAPGSRIPQPRVGSGETLPSVFVDASVSPKTAYVGQQVIAEWTLYTQVSISDYDPLKEPLADGFWSEPLSTKRLRKLTRQVVQNRVYYAGILTRRAFFPQRTGKLEIGSLEVRIEIPSGGLFFDKSESRKSKPVVVEVLPLPQRGQPAAFPPQNVGSFDIAATLDRPDVEVGEAAKLTITVRGAGNLKQLALPQVPRIKGLKVYEPKLTEKITSTTEVSGEKVAEHLLVATQPGLVKVPRLVLHFFDPAAKAYRSVETKELALRVSGKPAADPGLVVGGASGGKTNLIGPDIRPPRPPRELSHRARARAFGPMNAVLLALPLAALLLLVGGERLRERLMRPTARSRERAAARRVREQLARAAAMKGGTDRAAFFAALSAAINGQLRHQMQLAVEGLTRDELGAAMTRAGFAEELCAETLRQLDQCDAQRFAPRGVETDVMVEALRDTQRLVRRIAGGTARRRRGTARHGVAALLIVLPCLLHANPDARAETVDGSYRSALEAYYAGQYEKSAQMLERLTALPLHNEDLFYNLGNAYFRAGQVGPAIYNYERALALEPNADDARYNLDLARTVASKRVKDVLEGSLEQSRWTVAVKRLSLRGWWTSVIVLWWLVLGLFLAARYSGHGAARAAIVAVNGLLVAALLATSLLLVGRIRLATGRPEGIVLPETVAAREGPDASARETFKLHAGLRVRLESESAGWARVRLANGLEGWVRRQTVGIL